MPKAKESGLKDQDNYERKEEKRLKELEGKQYREFDDLAIKSPMGGSKAFYGDGQEQADFFANNSNFEELVKGMDSETRDIIYYELTQGHFMKGQQWGGWDNMDSYDQHLTRKLDQLFDKSVLNKGVVVTRLTSAEMFLGQGHKYATSLEQLQALRGQVVTANANMACSAAKVGLHIGDLGKNVELRIHIPAGTKGAGMWVSDERLNHRGREQREFVTNRNTAYRIGNTTSRIDHNGHKVYVVNLYFDGRMAHDYGSK